MLNMVVGFGEEAGATLVEAPGVRLISFTGSTEVGTEVAEKCARLGKRVSLEMGGKNAIVVLDDADLDLALDGIVWSAFGTSGQRCTAASRVIVQRGVAEELTARLVERAKRLKLGNGLDPETDVGPVINEQQLRRIAGYMDVARQEGPRSCAAAKSPGKGSWPGVSFSSRRCWATAGRGCGSVRRRSSGR
jgi:aldehyde dehydrogenase (NAD+)